MINFFNQEFYANFSLGSIVELQLMLFRFNLQNDGSLKNIGMSAIVGVGPWIDGRPENVASVLFRLAKFQNLVPRSRDRERLRMVLNLHDDFSADDILLSPIDAVMIHDSLQVLPTFERQLLIFRAFHGGTCVSYYFKTFL